MRHIIRKPVLGILHQVRCKAGCAAREASYEGDPRSNANPAVISSTFGISNNGLHVYL